MDSFWSILIVVAIIVISDQMGGKKKKLPPRPQPRTRERNLPKMPDIRPPEPIPEPVEIEIFTEPELPVLKQPALRRAETAARAPEPREETVMAAPSARPAGLGLTPEQALSALAWSEILGKPKAYRDGRFRK